MQQGSDAGRAHRPAGRCARQPQAPRPQDSSTAVHFRENAVHFHEHAHSLEPAPLFFLGLPLMSYSIRTPTLPRFEVHVWIVFAQPGRRAAPVVRCFVRLQQAADIPLPFAPMLIFYEILRMRKGSPAVGRPADSLHQLACFAFPCINCTQGRGPKNGAERAALGATVCPAELPGRTAPSRIA